MHRRSWMMLVAAAVAFGVSAALDGWAYQHIVVRDVYEKDWGRMLRVAGFLPTWLIVSGGLLLAERAPQIPRWRGAWPVLAATAGGLVAEVLKLLLRRERPAAHAGDYVFRAWGERTFSSGGLALPSSHAMVAFAAAAMMARLYPRGRWLWYGVATGCALTRVMARAHFLSDVVLAAIAGWMVTAALHALLVRRRAPVTP